jgi:hypothetical protein
MGDDNATFSQKQLDIPEAEAEHVVQPDSVADDLGRKAVAVVRIGRRFHAASLAALRPDCQIGYRDNAIVTPRVFRWAALDPTLTLAAHCSVVPGRLASGREGAAVLTVAVSDTRWTRDYSGRPAIRRPSNNLEPGMT